MPKYRKPVADLITFTDRVSQRVAKLERLPRAIATSVDRGSLEFNGGLLTINTGNKADNFPFMQTVANPTTLTNSIVIDQFDRNVSNTWGSYFDVNGGGYSYTISDYLFNGGSASDYNVTYSGTDHHGTATISIGTVNVSRSVIFGTSSITDAAMYATFSIPTLPVGAPLSVGSVFRVTTYGNYQVRALIQTDGSVIFNIVNNAVFPVAFDTVLATATVPNFTIVPGQKYIMYAEIVGYTIKAKIWLSGTSRPDTQISATDSTSNYNNGLDAFRVRLEAGNTNTLPYLVSFSQLNVMCNTNQVGIGSVQTDNAFTLYRHDSRANTNGTIAFGYYDLPYDPSFGINTLEMHDRWGGVIFSDASNGRGLGSPTLNVPFFDPAATKSTTSGTFTNFASTFWTVHHPKLRVAVLINVPSATTYEVRLNENGHNQQAIASVTNFFGYVYLIVDRNTTSVGGTDFSNGQDINLDLEWRRASGAGTATMVIAQVVGIDI